MSGSVRAGGCDSPRPLDRLGLINGALKTVRARANAVAYRVRPTMVSQAAEAPRYSLLLQPNVKMG